MRDLPFRLLAITPAVHPGLLDAVRRVASAGGADVAILLRDPGLSPDALSCWTERLLPACRASGTLLLVHARAEVAHWAGADGVHLPERGVAIPQARAVLGHAALIGVSRHDAAGLARASGADYATFSPVWATPGKAPAVGLRALADACRTSPTPIVALGGVTPERAGDCFGAGAAAVAAIRAVWEGDVAANVRAFLVATPSPADGCG